MAKITLYFPSQESYDAYWQGAQPGSKYLCIIENSGIEGVDNVLVTSSNNNQASSEIVPMGASTIEIISAQQEEIETQYAIIDDYENDETVSRTEYNLLVDEIDEATDIAYDISGEEEPFFEDGFYLYDTFTGLHVPFIFDGRSEYHLMMSDFNSIYDPNEESEGPYSVRYYEDGKMKYEYFTDEGEEEDNVNILDYSGKNPLYLDKGFDKCFMINYDNNCEITVAIYKYNNPAMGVNIWEYNNAE